MRFQSTANNGTKDCLFQDFTTVAGQKYNVTFWVAITTNSSFGGGANTQLDPQWDESTSNNTTMADASYFSPTGAFKYQQFSFVETATTNLTRIDFHAVDATGSILVDDVSVTVSSTVPEPSSLFLLGFSASVGSCVFCFHRVRKRRASVC